jgi:hypothetical protein
LLLIPALSRAQGAGDADKGDMPLSLVDDPHNEILVMGDGRSEAEAIRDLVAVVTKRDPSNKPLPRFYQPFCPLVLGIRADYASLLVERIRSNAREAGALVAIGKCQPNALLILTRHAGNSLKELRSEQPWLFTDMSETDATRLLEDSKQVFAWQTSEIRGSDGKPIRTVEVEIGMPPVRRELTVNDQWQAGRLNQPIRVDVSGAIVLFDSRYLPGKTLIQLADYASMRLLASTDDVPAEAAASIPTILSLFTAPEGAPPALTPFDLGYLRARYSLRPNANPLAIKDATVKSYTQETSK